MRALGIALVLAGVVALGYRGFTYSGPVPRPAPGGAATLADLSRPESVWGLPLAGATSLVSGVLALAAGRRDD